MNIGGVDPESASKLISLLDGYGITYYDRQNAEAWLLEGTYCIPNLLQSACDHLLRRLDKRQTAHVELDDVRSVLEVDVLSQLKQELLDDLQVDYAEEGVSPACLKLRMQIMLLAIVLEKFSYKELEVDAYRRLRPENRSFTAQDVVDYLCEWARDIKDLWLWSEEEVDTMLRSLTLTLALSPEDDQRAYYCPEEILPDVLFELQAKDSRYNMVVQLNNLIELYKEFYPRNR